jgi:signal transduction histidine kinase
VLRVSPSRATTHALAVQVERAPAPEIQPERVAAMVAHDLESSLLAASAHIAMLREAGPALTPGQEDHVERIARSLARMRRLSAGMRDSARAGSEPQFEPVALGDLVQEVLETLTPLIGERQAAVVVSPELPVVHADRTQLGQLFENLLSNAIKFGPSRAGRVTLNVSRVRAGWRIAVSDQGPGVLEEDQERIFEAFRRLPGSRREPGTGLGLAICRRVAEAHGGTLRIDGRARRGATFVFTLPDV